SRGARGPTPSSLAPFAPTLPSPASGGGLGRERGLGGGAIGSSQKPFARLGPRGAAALRGGAAEAGFACDGIVARQSAKTRTGDAWPDRLSLGSRHPRQSAPHGSGAPQVPPGHITRAAEWPAGPRNEPVGEVGRRRKAALRGGAQPRAVGLYVAHH